MKFATAQPVVLAIALFVGLACSPAKADLTYSLDFEFDNYVVFEDENVEIKVYLTETATDGDTARLLDDDQDNGLLSFDASIDFTQVTPTGPGATFVTANAAPEFFEFVEGQGTSAFAFYEQENGVVSFQSTAANFLTSTSGVSGEQISASVFRLELATFTFSGAAINFSAAATNTTTLQLQSWDDPAALGLAFADTASREPTFGSTQIVTVPEATSISLLALTTGILTLRRRR